MNNTPTTCVASATKLTGLSLRSLDASVFSAAAITSAGAVVAWGLNSSGQLGHTPGTMGDETNGNNSAPRQVQGLP